MKKCPVGHSLMYTRNGADWMCDGCGGGTCPGVNNAPKRFKCQQCDCDHCDKCYTANGKFTCITKYRPSYTFCLENSKGDTSGVSFSKPQKI